MKLKALATAVLATTTMGLSVARPGFSQTDLNAQLRQAVCSQNWNQATQITEQMKKVAGSEYASQLTRYQGRLEALARTGVRVPTAVASCSTLVSGISVASTSTLASNNVRANAPTNTTLPVKGIVKIKERSLSLHSEEYKGFIVKGEIVNNTNNSVSQVKVGYKIVVSNRLNSAEEISFSTITDVNPVTLQPGETATFTRQGIPVTIKGRDVKVVSVQWINNSDNSQGFYSLR